MFTCSHTSSEWHEADLRRSVYRHPKRRRATSSGWIAGEGYIADRSGRSLDPDTVASRLDQNGLGALGEFDGVFVLFGSHKGTQLAWCATDPKAALPLYWSQSDANVVVSTHPLEIPARGELNAPCALGYLLCGYPLGRDTLVSGVHTLAPGSVLVVGKQRRVTISSYCELPIDPAQGFQTEEEVLAAIEGSLRGILGRFDRILLPLSGGVDSRLLAVALARLGAPFEAVTLIHQETEGTDWEIAHRVATALGVPHHPWSFQADDFVAKVKPYVLQTAGLNDAFTTYPMGFAPISDLASQFDVWLRGDQTFGCKATSTSFDAALAALEIPRGDALAAYGARYSGSHGQGTISLVDLIPTQLDFTTQEHVDPDQWKSEFFRLVRVPNYFLPVARFWMTFLPVEFPFLTCSFMARMESTALELKNSKAMARRTLDWASPQAIREIPFKWVKTWTRSEPFLAIPKAEMAMVLDQLMVSDEIDGGLELDVQELVDDVWRSYNQLPPKQGQPKLADLANTIRRVLRRAGVPGAILNRAMPVKRTIPAEMAAKRLFSIKLLFSSLRGQN